MFKQIICLLLLTLTACGPIYTKEYEIIPPETTQGALCASNCVLARVHCDQACQNKTDQCYRIKQLESENEYLQQVNQSNASQQYSPKKYHNHFEYFQQVDQQHAPRPYSRKKYNHNFDYFNNCDNTNCINRCEMDYHICHKNCGGEVITYNRCVAFCP